MTPIRAVIVYPYVGGRGHSWSCRPNNNASSTSRLAFAGDVYTASRSDPWLGLELPFAQTLELVVRDDHDTEIARRVVSFSCDDLQWDTTTSPPLAFFEWGDVLTVGRTVRVTKQAPTSGPLMLHEVQVRRWNPATTPQFVLLDLRARGDAPLALNSVRIFAPTDDSDATAYATPLAYRVHSVSSQRAATGHGSAATLMDAANDASCYVAASASYREWIVLEVLPAADGRRPRVGLIDVDTAIGKCGAGLAPVQSVSVAVQGAKGIASRADETVVDASCRLSPSAVVAAPDACGSKRFVCVAAGCNAPTRANAAGGSSDSTLWLADFADVVVFGKPAFVPTTRLPLTTFESRAMLLRENPVTLWTFDDEAPAVALRPASSSSAGARMVHAVPLSTTTVFKTLPIDDTREQTFFSNAVAVQPAMSAFSIELWVRFMSGNTPSDLLASGGASSVSLVSMTSTRTPTPTPIAELIFSKEKAPDGSFVVRDPATGKSCAATFYPKAPTVSIARIVDRWLHVVASYDPGSARVVASVRWTVSDAQDAKAFRSVATEAACALPLLSVDRKSLVIGAASALKPGFIGVVTHVAFYLSVLDDAELQDHFLDLSFGGRGQSARGFDDSQQRLTLAHDAYALRLTARPLTAVTIDVHSEDACYRFGLCNVTVVPSAVTILPEAFNVPHVVRVLATDDQLYESLHKTHIDHWIATTTSVMAATSTRLQRQTSIVTEPIESPDVALAWRQRARRVLNAWDRDRVLRRVVAMSDASRLAELHANWTTQRVLESLESVAPYASPTLSIGGVGVDITDATVPGVQLSTASLAVSEDGHGNDFQLVLLSEPTSDVVVRLDAEQDCYRPCRPVGQAQPRCASLSAALLSALDGGGSSDADVSDPEARCGNPLTGSRLLCNITLAPVALTFTPSNWSFPQTVRVAAVDDFLDEADLHRTAIRVTAESLDPVYHKVFVPDVVVLVQDNDNSGVEYSTRALQMTENPATSALGGDWRNATAQYALSLTTEPWANVTIAMRNDRPRCYRACGFHFDDNRGRACGLPRVQSVSRVRLATKSPREIHRVALSLPRVMEVQRIVSTVDHVDQVVRVTVRGGVAPNVQRVTFQFDATFKRRFPSVTAVNNALYLRTFRIGLVGTGLQSTSIDGFAPAARVESAANALLRQWLKITTTSGNPIVTVSRELLYDDARLQWTLTFQRFVAKDLSFPRFTATVDAPFDGSLVASAARAMALPSGSLVIEYGDPQASSSSTSASENTSPAPAIRAELSLLASDTDMEAQLRDLDDVYTVSVSRSIVTDGFGLQYTLTFIGVENYRTLKATSDALVGARDATDAVVRVDVTQLQAPAQLGGTFSLRYDVDPWFLFVNAKSQNETTAATTAVNVTTTTPPLAWNASETQVRDALQSLTGVGNVSVARRRLSPEGAMEWRVEFRDNNGNLPALQPQMVALSGPGASVVVDTVANGESLSGWFSLEVGGGLFKRRDSVTGRVFDAFVTKKNTTTPLPFNATADAVASAIEALAITERPDVTRVDRDCDAFLVCLGYTWTISYARSPGNLPPIAAYGVNTTLSGAGVTLSAATVANGTYLGGFFSLSLELLDRERNVTLRGTTWLLPVNVSVVGMDEALEALPFVRADREAEYDPETRQQRRRRVLSPVTDGSVTAGVDDAHDELVDKGVVVTREGPFLDGGHEWRLAWALEDHARFQDLRIFINTTLVTQEIEPFAVPSELDLEGRRRCDAIPDARFAADARDVFGLRGTCVYDLVAVAAQERSLCNFTVETPWLVFTPEDWCSPHVVQLSATDDWLDERTAALGNVTHSMVTHSVWSDDVVYASHVELETIDVAVESDDIAAVLVSATELEVSEDGVLVATYDLVLRTEPRADVRVVALPWRDSRDPQCYRFGLCNVTFDVDTFVFAPHNWDLPQRVTVRATDDALDEADAHATAISHRAFSTDVQYDGITIPTINVTVFDNDVSALVVTPSTTPQLVVAEGGRTATYEVVLATEPFGRVDVSVTNIGTRGNLATATPSRLVFTWRNWSVPQVVTVTAVDDFTVDALDSASVMVHALRTNDAIYAALRALPTVPVRILDNDVAGLELSTLAMDVAERAASYTYGVRLTSEPWQVVTVRPDAQHDCYRRVRTQEMVCNASVATTSAALVFGASNWSDWQQVTFFAVDDPLDEAAIHTAKITHSSTSLDTLYELGAAQTPVLQLAIADNDDSAVKIALADKRTALHVAEGGFNDSYAVSLATEPYEDVVVVVHATIERIVDLSNPSLVVSGPQIGAAARATSTVTGLTATSASRWTRVNGSTLPLETTDLALVFTPLDWSTPRVVTVFAIDDEIAEDPTQRSTLQHAVASADALYNVSDVTHGLVDIAVLVSDREAIPPPLPTAATFDSTGTRLVVAFDSSVFHAETMSISPTTGTYSIRLRTFACSLVFNATATPPALFGSGATCLWLSGATQLQVNLGAGATITPGAALVLHECTTFVRQICTSTTVLRARHTSRGYSQGRVLVTLASDMPLPRVALSLPDAVGSCGAWTADATLSTGAVGRRWAQIKWTLLPKAALGSSSSSISSSNGPNDATLRIMETVVSRLDKLCAKPSPFPIVASDGDSDGLIAAFIASAADAQTACYLRDIATRSSTSLALTVDSSRLPAGATLVVMLQLQNAFAQRAIALRLVTIQALAGPVVVVQGDSTRSITRSDGDALVLQVDATLSCPRLMGKAVDFRWFAWSFPSTNSSSSNTDSATPIDLNATNSARDPRVFRVPKTRLVAGRTYRFRAEAALQDKSIRASVGRADMLVTVGFSPLRPVLQGGDRAIGERDTLVLNASLSSDPDATVVVGGSSSSSAAAALRFSWSCEDITVASTTSPCLNASMLPLVPLEIKGTASGVVTLAPFSLQPERKLRFQVNVSTSREPVRQSSVATTIWTATGSLPDVQIAASATTINPSSRVTLTATVKSTYPVTTRWQQDQGDLVLAANSSTHAAFSMPLTSASNAINRNQLTPGQTYVFRLVATDLNGMAGSGIVTIRVNAPPTSGTCVVSPTDGFAVQDTFSLSCEHWTDDLEDLPLRYAFGAIPTAKFEALEDPSDLTRVRALMSPLVSEQLSSSALVSMLPPTDGSMEQNVTVVALIADRLGATAMAASSVLVRLPAEATTQPVAFVSALVSAGASLDAGQQATLLLSGARIMNRALGVVEAADEDALATPSALDSECDPSDTTTTPCSGHGACDASTLRCRCSAGFAGPQCAFSTLALRDVNDVLLGTLRNASNRVEPTPSGLAQQSLVVRSVLEGAASLTSATTPLYDGDGVEQLTALTKCHRTKRVGA
ncbi:hypothetical protein PINS_up005463 [Pythium insidiosum]|nr:hypothetical protein PINS_up005463 [Pythium insidiosum]